MDNEQIWDEAEHNFWNRFRRQGETESAELREAYEKAVEEVNDEAKTLEAKRLQAVGARDCLRQQLNAAEKELAEVDARCEENADMMKDLEEDFQQNEEVRLARRESVKRQMARFFLRKRGHQVLSDTEDEDERPERIQKKPPVKKAAGKRSRRPSPQPSPERTAKRSRRGTTVEDLDDAGSGNEADEIRERRALESSKVSNRKPVEKDPASEPETAWGVPVGEALTVIKDAHGNVIGPLKRIETWNQWHEVLQQLPIKRSISVRQRRRFGRADLESIYKRMEKKGLKWLACMIQATGEIRGEPCTGCKRGLGPFTECIFIDDELFPKCGNCEWGRQGCHDAAGSTNDGVEAESQQNESQSAEGQAQDANAADSNTTSSLGMEHEVEQEDGHETQQEIEQETEQETEREREPRGERERQQPSEQRRELVPERESEQECEESILPAQSARAEISETNLDMEMADHILTSSPLTSLAGDMSSPQWPPFERTDEVNLTPITRENLVLKHNGTVYTFPEVVDGVPVEKIDENHPYWDPTWQDVKSSTQQMLDRWVERLEETKKLRESGGETVQSQRWHTGRQVNRGLRILDFLEKGEISPYQLLGKKFTVSGKGSITAYDTLFRLCETLSELEKFRLDVRPLEWMRHRLHEIWLEQGKSINLCKVIRHFYNDPKLVALRADAGFKNIGRPSGTTSKADRPGGVAALPLMDSPCRQPEKRTSIDTPLVTPLSKRPRLSLEIPSPSESPTTHPIEPSAESAAAHDGNIRPSEDGDDENETEDDAKSPSDTDTYSGGPLSKDDFRVYQVKSRLYTSSPQVTQYLHWFREKNKFEHQVLKRVNPVHWAYLKQPIDFDVHIEDVAGVSFSQEALMAELALGENSRVFIKDGLPRGNIMIAFKRVSTLKRFIVCLRDLSVPVTNLPQQVITDRWAEMKSEQLPDTDAEASEDFRN